MYQFFFTLSVIFLFYSCSSSSSSAETKPELLQETSPKVEKQSAADIQIQLDSIYYYDQLYRTQAEALRKKNNGVYTDEEKELWSQQAVLDRENMEKLDVIIREQGFPGKSKVGETHDHIGINVILHNSDVPYQYLPMLMRLGEKGEVEKSLVAQLQDRVLMYRDEPQIYGTQMTYKTDADGNKKITLYTTQDLEHVNARRSMVGLPTIEEQLKEFGVEE